MAVKKATKKTTKEVTTKIETNNNEVLASTSDDLKTDGLTGADVVYLSVGIRGGVKFTDLGTNNNETYVITGLDHQLRGQKSGILTADGNAIMISIKRSIWEDIKAKHGKEQMFLGDSNHAPLIFEVGSKEDFRARKDEIATSITGLAPKDLAELGVQEAHI